jgi:hypothetical protein
LSHQKLKNQFCENSITLFFHLLSFLYDTVMPTDGLDMTDDVIFRNEKGTGSSTKEKFQFKRSLLNRLENVFQSSTIFSDFIEKSGFNDGLSHTEIYELVYKEIEKFIVLCLIGPKHGEEPYAGTCKRLIDEESGDLFSREIFSSTNLKAIFLNPVETEFDNIILNTMYGIIPSSFKEAALLQSFNLFLIDIFEEEAINLKENNNISSYFFNPLSNKIETKVLSENFNIFSNKILKSFINFEKIYKKYCPTAEFDLIKKEMADGLLAIFNIYSEKKSFYGQLLSSIISLISNNLNLLITSFDVKANKEIFFETISEGINKTIILEAAYSFLVKISKGNLEAEFAFNLSFFSEEPFFKKVIKDIETDMKFPFKGKTYSDILNKLQDYIFRLKDKKPAKLKDEKPVHLNNERPTYEELIKEEAKTGKALEGIWAEYFPSTIKKERQNSINEKKRTATSFPFFSFEEGNNKTHPPHPPAEKLDSPGQK